MMHILKLMAEIQSKIGGTLTIGFRESEKPEYRAAVIHWEEFCGSTRPVEQIVQLTMLERCNEPEHVLASFLFEVQRRAEAQI